jgi:hypothetical protein
LFGCSQNHDSLAGNGTASETTNHISGVITEGDGSVPGAEVFLFSTNYNPVDKWDDSQFRRSVETGENGEYLFENIPAGSYNLIARNSGSGSAALVRGVQLTEDKPDISSLAVELEETGSITVSLAKRLVRDGDYFYLPGTDVYARITASSIISGTETLESVPSGSYPAVNLAQTASSSGTNIIGRQISLAPGEVVMVGPYALWTSVSKVFINTTSSGADVSGDVHDFPMLVRLSSSSITLSLSKGDGSDLRFTKSDRITDLAYEIERWDRANGIAEVWVKMDTVYGNNDVQFIYMYTGNSDAPAQTSGPAVFAKTDGFVGVYHTEEGPELRDASENDNTGIIRGSIDAGDWVDAVVNNGLELDGDSQFVYTTRVYDSPNVFTLSAWVRTAVPGGRIMGFVESPEFVHSHDRQIWMGDDGKMYFGVYPISPDSIAPEDSMYWRSDSGMEMTVYSDSACDDGEWHLVTASLSGQGQYLYVDGRQVASRPSVTSGEDFAGVWRIGYGNIHSWIHKPTNSDFQGTIDEVRISHAGRSPDWIKLSFENQRRNSTVVRIEE